MVWLMEHVIDRYFAEPKQSYFLFGPRGTGKSTITHLRHPDALLIDLLQPEVLRSYMAYPERLKEVISAAKPAIVIIDEVQKAPSLLSIIHSLIEQKLGIQFILTGSSARKLKRTSADLLGGRALKKELHPFMAAELGSQFSLKKALHHGLLHLLFDAPNPQDVLHAYVNLYLREEIHAEGLVRNIENFSRFLEVITFSHGAQLNTTNIARECEVKRKTVENYISILEDLLLAFQLDVFSKRAQRELVSHPEEIEGAALEGLVAQHLRAWNDYSQTKYHLSYWRTRTGLEVDFIVYGEKGFWAIEVKNTKRILPQDTKHLEIFLKDYPMAKAILLYRGDEMIQKGNVLCIPCSKFLLELKPNQPLV